jgi:phage-related minor tail protein
MENGSPLTKADLIAALTEVGVITKTNLKSAMTEVGMVTKADLKSAMTELRSEFKADMRALEDRMMQEMRQIETNLLTEFHRYGKGQQLRLHSLETRDAPSV